MSTGSESVLLMLSPRWLFLYPGLALLAVGAAAQLTIRTGPVGLGHIVLDIHTMLFAAGAVVIGLQMGMFALFVEAAGVAHGVLPSGPAFRQVVKHFSLERGVVAGLLIALAGFILAIQSVSIWMATGLSEIEPRQVMRVVIPALTLLVAGFQIVLSSFVLSFLMWNLDD